MKLSSLFRKNWGNWSDKDLMRAFCGKEKDVYFDALFERYHPFVYKVCFNITANREVSKELTLDVFLKASQQIKIVEIESFKDWIFILTKNTCLTFIRKEKSETKNRVKLWILENNEPEFMENAVFRRLIYDDEESQLYSDFRQCLENISDNQQLCIKSFFLQGLSYKEIAARNEMTEKQVKSYIQNGKRQLKNAMLKLESKKQE